MPGVAVCTPLRSQSRSLLMGAAWPFMGLGAFLLGQRIAPPITALAATARAGTRGQLQARVSSDGSLEGTLVAAEFNEMLDARLQDERALEHSAVRLRLVAHPLRMIL